MEAPIPHRTLPEILDEDSALHSLMYPFASGEVLRVQAQGLPGLGWNGRRYRRRLKVKYTLQEVEEEIKGLLGGKSG